MGNYIQCGMLANQDPSLPNRGLNSKAKTILEGNKTRAFASSYGMKRVLREEMELNEIRSASLENLVDDVLDGYIAEGMIDPSMKDKIGNDVCTAIGADWAKRTSKTGEEKVKVPDDTAEDEDGEEKLNGRTVVVTNTEELRAIINAFVNYANAAAKPKDKKAKAGSDALADAYSALKRVRMSEAKALFGAMSTSKVIETVDACVNFSHSFSIDPVNVMRNNFTAKYSERNSDEADDPFSRALATYSHDQKEKVASETLGSEDLYSVTMYSHMEINVPGFYEPFYKRESCPTKKELQEMAEERISTLVRKYALAHRSAKQASGSNKVAPGIYYIEVIENGVNCGIDFNKPIYYRDDLEHGSVMEQGIEVFLRHSKSCFTEGKVTKYVMLGPEYIDYYGPRFEAAGVHVVHSFDELDKIIRKAVKDLSKEG